MFASPRWGKWFITRKAKGDSTGYDRLGLKKSQKNVFFGAERLIAALHPDDVVIGGGNAKKMKKMPDGFLAGDNRNAFIGGFRMWADETKKGKG